MDSFTENILTRARERQKLLNGYVGDERKIEHDLIVKENGKQTPEWKEINCTDVTAERSQQCVSTNLPFCSTSDKNFKQPILEVSASTSPIVNKVDIERENLSMEIKVTSRDNVRVEVEIEESSGDDTVQVDNGIRIYAKEKLKRLGRLYAGGDDAISSPIHRTEDTFLVEHKAKEIKSKATHGKGLKGLANLAKEINHWEHDIKEHRVDEKQSNTSYAVKPPVSNIDTQRSPRKSMIPSTPVKDRINQLNTTSKMPYVSPKKEVSEQDKYIKMQKPTNMKWDKAVLDSLESQGFERKIESGLIFEYPSKNNKEFLQSKKDINCSVKDMYENNSAKEKDMLKSGFRHGVSEKVSHFETTQKKLSPQDPSGLSIIQRKALFEKNGEGPLLPKAPFAMPIPVKTYNAGYSQSNSTKISKAEGIMNEKKKQTPEISKHNSPYKSVNGSPIKYTSQVIEEEKHSNTEGQSIDFETQCGSGPQHQDQDFEYMPTNRNKTDTKIGQSDDSAKSNITSETNLIFKAEDDGFSIRSRNKRPSVSPKVAAVLEDVKKIKVSPAKPGQMYPNLSDIEATDERSISSSDNNSDCSCHDDLDTSFGRDIMAKVYTTPKSQNYDETSTPSKLLSVLEHINANLDDSDLDDFDCETTSSKFMQDTSQPSHSFNYRNYRSPLKNVKSPNKANASFNSSSGHSNLNIDEEKALPLAHTVSFYRKQASDNLIQTPVKQVSKNTAEIFKKDDYEYDAAQAKIQTLQGEVKREELIIAQTSQALNLCNSTPEFMGSTEQVEAERVLLLSTHRRQEILNEIQRLKVEGTLRPQIRYTADGPSEKRSVTISSIVLSLKQEYVRALAAAGGKGHHVTCLFKSGEEVVATKLVSTVASDFKNPCYDLNIPSSLVLKNVYKESAITFEVYCLQAQEEILPHEIKYHIKKSKSTPKKAKHDFVMCRTQDSSMGQAMRTPSFALMGYVVFSLSQINKKYWTLNNAPPMSPLEGTVEMLVSCKMPSTVEHRGFLAMFDDISGFGAWHRRWCLLKNNALSYWKYPDEEKKTASIGTIYLKSCITKEVTPVSKEICARPNTFLLETIRERTPYDKDTLITLCKDDQTILRHLLSADTKEERIEWCSKLNSSLLTSN